MGEPGVKIVRVQNPEAMASEEVSALFERSFEKIEGLEGGDVLAWVADRLSEPDLALFVAVADGNLTGMTILFQGQEPLSPFAWIAHFHAEEGSRAPLLDSVVGWMRDRGLQKIRVINMTGRSDKAHMRLFRSHAKGSVVASIIEYDIGETE